MVRRHASPVRWRAARDDTISARSVSTGRSPSVPRCCAPPSPDAIDQRAPVADAHPAPAFAAVEGGRELEVGARNTDARVVLREQAHDVQAGGGPLLHPRLQIRRGHRRRLTEIDRPSVEVVVVPRSDEINAVKNALSLALVGLVDGTRPSVTPAMVHEHLRVDFGVDDAAMSIMRHAPEDFIVCFSRSLAGRTSSGCWPRRRTARRHSC